MLQLKNSTPFKAQIMLLPNRGGIDTLYTVVKGTFTLGESLGLAEEQVPVTLADEYHGDPTASSIRAASDVSIGKPSTDVVINGSAWAPGGNPTWQMDVSASVGPVAKSIRVFADRVWDVGSGVATISWVAPFVRMPLVWERAFGGTDVTDKGAVMEPRNPAGAGFRASDGTKPLAGLPLPNVEDPRALISGPGDSPAPAGFAPIAPNWEPRARGTILGLTRGSNRAHLARAALEAMAYGSAEMLGAMAKRGRVKFESLRVDGGAAANNWLLQFQSDILGIPVERPDMIETTALGAAGLAGLSGGVWRDSGEFVGTRQFTRFTPAMEGDAAEALVSGWQRAVRSALSWARDEGDQSGRKSGKRTRAGGKSSNKKSARSAAKSKATRGRSR